MAKEKVIATSEQKTDLSFYKVNKLGYNVILLVICFELYYLVSMLNVMTANYLVGAFILINIAILLVLFTSALQVKVYHMSSSYLIAGFGAYCISRVISIHLLTSFSVTTVVLSVICVVMGLLSIFAGIDSIKKIKSQRQYIADGKINFVQLSK